MRKKTLVGLVASVLAATACARTVYDASKALRQNCTAADANGGAFNGLTLVGDLPDYVEAGTILVIR